MAKNLFVGTWELLSSEIRLANGAVIHPLGESSQGLLILDEHGTLAAQLMRPDRPKFAGGDLLGGSPAEMEAAYKGYVAFYGRYEIDEARGMMRYTVRGSLFPNWIGHAQERFFSFSAAGNELELRTPPMSVGGHEGVGVLRWRRVVG